MPRGPRILWIAPSWLGDAVLSLPALEWLAGCGAEVEVLARRGVERVYAENATSVHVVASRSRLQRLGATWRLRQRDYAAAVVLPPSFSAALLACASGARQRIGARTGGRAALLTRALPDAGRDVHLAVAYQELATTAWNALDGAAATPSLQMQAASIPLTWPRLHATADETAAAAALLAAVGLPAAGALVLAPGARFGAAKRYPAAAFAAVGAAAATRYQAPVVLVGSAADAAATAAVGRLLPSARDLAGRTSLGSLIGLLATARAIVSNDSGVMHLAAALGAPVVGIFGSTNPNWTRPLGRHATHIVHHVPCAPCYRRTCPIDFPCMHGIAPERVLEALDAMVADDGPGGRAAVTPLCSRS